MELIHLLNGPEMRGAESFALQLASELNRLNLKQRIIFLQPPNSSLLNIDFCKIETFSKNHSMLSRWAWLRHILGYDPNNIVLCHGQGPLKAAVLSLILRSHRPKLVIKTIGFYEPWISSFKRLRLTINRWLLSYVELCIVLGPRQEEELTGLLNVSKKNIVRIPNGRIPPNTTSKVIRKDDEIIMVGSLSIEKNVTFGLEILKQVHRKYPGTKLKYVGDGPLLELLRAKSMQDFSQGVVSFTGNVNDVWPHLYKATLLLLCSETEGVPGVIIEACFAGLPVVAWDVGDTATVLRDGINGRLTSFGDFSALEKAVLELLGDKNERNRLEKEALNMAQEFRLDNVAINYKKALNCLSS